MQWLCLHLLLLVAGLGSGGCHTIKPPPIGTDFSGGEHPAARVKFLADVTYVDDNGTRHSDQQIFDEVFKLIHGARRFILVDMFLFNDFQGASPEYTRLLSSELTEALLARKRHHPDIEIVVITDPINIVYGGIRSPQLDALHEAGIQVTMSRLEKLRDSNLIYSWAWRLTFRWLGNSTHGGWFPHPFDDDRRVTGRTWLRMLNFKANHRKVFIADTSAGFEAIVTSANVHDASSAHHNVAIRFSGPAVADLFESELAVLRFSKGNLPKTQVKNLVESGRVTTQVVTEKQIERVAIKTLRVLSKGDRMDLAYFFLSDQGVIRELKKAHARGATLRILLDPNKDAFGYTKMGIPNRQVARNLNQAGLALRWFNTHGEQGHSKMMHAHFGEGHNLLLLGSCNLTRRNLDNFNLETNVVLRGPADAPVFRDASAYFERSWANRPGETISAPYEKYAELAYAKHIFSRLLEIFGMGTF